jgi:acetyl-CoA carboxylase biotin carboxyl carrier protein
MDIRKVKKLIELLDESGIAEIEITEGEESVRISRYPAGVPMQIAAPIAAAPPPVPVAASTVATSAPESAGESESPEGHLVTSPMVGTFYDAPNPGAEVFVKVGDQVEIGDTLCIIEAMKMMNQIDTEVAGVVKSVQAQSGEPVEFGQLLFVIA